MNIYFILIVSYSCYRNGTLFGNPLIIILCEMHFYSSFFVLGLFSCSVVIFFRKNYLKKYKSVKLYNQVGTENPIHALQSEMGFEPGSAEVKGRERTH